MNSNRVAEVLLLFLFVAVPSASAARPAGSEPAPSVEDLVSRALEASPSVAALLARLSSARESVEPAASLPDPVVEVGIQNVGLDTWTVGETDMSMVTPEFRQGFSYPGKLRATRAEAEANAELVERAVDAARRQLTLGVRIAYARLYAVDRETELLAAGRELLDLLKETAIARYRVGQSDQEAVLKAQLEVSRLAERDDDLTAERLGLVAGLNALLDRPGDAQLGDVVRLPPVQASTGGIESEALERSAEVLARRAALAAAERRLDVARTRLKPDLFASAGVGYRGGLDPAFMLRLGAEVPLRRRSRQEPLLRSAEHDVEAAAAEVRHAEAGARAEAARLAANWRRSERQVVRYREAFVPQASAAFDAARASYLAGRGDFSTVIEDYRLWLDTRAALARREAERFATWAEIASLVGSAESAGRGETR
ncbi:MAG: TolC family protein [Acidobacteriota bacterium]